MHLRCNLQELHSILEQIPGLQQQQASAWGKAAVKHAKGAVSQLQGPDASPPDTPPASRIQMFVFSATLTLPHSLRRRLRKGALGGPSDVSTARLA